MDIVMYGDFNVLCVQVVINDGDQDEVECLLMVVLEELLLVNYYSCIVVILVYGEVFYCKGKLIKFFVVMQQIEQMVCCYDVWYYVLWSIIQ